MAAQEGDPGSLLACYRGLLALRRAEPALQAGKLDLHDAARYPSSVVAYRRTLGAGGDTRFADVLLNFGRRAVTVDLPDPEGRRLWSNRRGELRPAEARYALEPYEGVVILSPGA